MRRPGRFLLVVMLLLVFDVVTIFVPLLAPPWNAVLWGAGGLAAATYLLLRALDWRMHRDHRRAAYQSLQSSRTR